MEERLDSRPSERYVAQHTGDTGVPMSDENEQDTATGLSRRSLIKRSVVVGGLVWAAPVMQSVASAATPGSPPPTTTTTSTSPSTSTSTSTTSTTTQPEPCDCTFCAIVSGPGGSTLYFTCAPTSSQGCDCLCKCGGVNRPCSQADPCTVEVTCVQTTQAMCGA